MEATYCHRCGTRIKNVFLFQGNKYGSECIEKIPFEESFVREGIDTPAVIQSLIYAKVKTADINEIINKIPAIGTRIDVHEGMFQIVVGYGKMQVRRRKNKEFAVRVKNIFPTAPRYNNEGWMKLMTAINEKTN